MIDKKLADAVTLIRSEIRRIADAALPVDTIVAAELATFDQRAAEFRVNPFKLQPATYGGAITAAAVERHCMAMAGALIPNSRKLYEAALRDKLEASPQLRLAPAERERQLATLHDELRVASAKLETERRRIEAASGNVLPRGGEDPGIWLLQPADLQRAVNGEQPVEVKIAEPPSPDDPGGRRAPGATAGAI